MWKHPDTCIWFEYPTSMALIMLNFHRHWPLCSASVFGGNSSNWASWCHGNGNLYFHHCWAPAWTSDWPQVNAGIIWSVASRKTWTFLQNACLQDWIAISWFWHRCDFTESCWAKKSTGPSCSPPHVSQHSCSSSSCPGSQRVHATCLLTEEMWREVRKVNQCAKWLPICVESQEEDSCLQGCGSSMWSHSFFFTDNAKWRWFDTGNLWI